MASRASWETHVAAWKRSGLSATAYAARHRLNANTLGWWSSRLAHSVPAVRFARVVPATLAPASPLADAGLEIVLGSGRVLRVRPGVDPALLRTVLDALEAP